MTHLNENEVKSAVNEMMNDDATKALAAAKKAYPYWADIMTGPVRNPGIYRVYSIGTTADVTVLVWLHNDGSANVQHVCW